MINCIEIIFGKTYNSNSMLFKILDLFKMEVEIYRIASGDLSAYLCDSKYTSLFEKNTYTYIELYEKQHHPFEIDSGTILAFPTKDTVDICTEDQLIQSKCIYGISIVDYNEYYFFSVKQDIIVKIESLCSKTADIKYRIGNLKNMNILQMYTPIINNNHK